MTAMVEQPEYRWRNDLVERHSLTLVGPEGWLAHVLRTDDGGWYGYADNDSVVAPQADLKTMMGLVYGLVAYCRWPAHREQGRCDVDRAPYSPFCFVHTSVYRRRGAVTEAADDRYAL